MIFRDRGAGHWWAALVPLALISVGLIHASCSTAPADTSAPTDISPVTTTPPQTTTSSTSPPTTSAPTTTTTEPLPPLEGLDLEVVADDLTEPILLLPLPGTEELLIMERRGTVVTLSDRERWLDIDERVNSEDGIEPGLLGLAFHPDFESNGRFYAYYYRSDAERTRLSEFQVIGGRADPGSERMLLEIDKPTNRHNGGMVQFGPDGYLYLSVGEGGKASVNAQNPATLLGKILRIDVDGGDPYGIPPDNPYVSGGGAPEVIAYGLRNPWRTWIDHETKTIYIADVGQEDVEEVNVVSLDSLPGTNFGWLRMEGSQCFQRGCDPVAEDLTLPVVEYPHSEGCSITGGVVYRGTAIPELTGHYLYADWCTGFIRGFTFADGAVTDETTWIEKAGQVNGFGFDLDGEIYLLTFDGSVKKIVPVRR